MSILRKYAHLFTRHRWSYVVGGLFLALTNAMALAIPRVLGWAIDALDQGTTQAVLLGYGGVIVVLAIVQALTRVGSRIWVLSISRKVDWQLKGMLHDRLLRLAPSFFGAVNTGDLMSRMTNDVMLVRALGGPGVLYFFNALLVYVMGIGFMLSISWQLTLVAFLPMPIMAWLVRGLVHKVKEYARASRVALSDLNTTVQENLAGVMVVKSFALEDAQVARFDDRSRSYMEWGLKEAWTRAQMIPLVGLGGGLASLASLALGARMVAAGRLSPGDLVAFFSYVGVMLFPTVALGWILSLIQRGAAALERLDDVLEAPITIDTAATGEPPPAGGADIRVRGLTFRYGDVLGEYRNILGELPDGDGRRPALIEVDFEAPENGFVALVGKVGSGKSTLLKSLLRLVEVPEGTVWFGGRDITELDLLELRRRIGYVPQDDFLFSATVRDNIAFGRPDAPDERVRAVAETAGLGPDLEQMPEGLATRVGERGLTLSGGQRQRTALARALLLGPRVLVLDNALSNVDADTERRIFERLRAAGRASTLVVVSNRIGAIQDADRIYVFEDGRVVDAGRHEELVARPGLYSTMVEQQRLSRRLERL